MYELERSKNSSLRPSIGNGLGKGETGRCFFSTTNLISLPQLLFQYSSHFFRYRFAKSRDNFSPLRRRRRRVGAKLLLQILATEKN